MANRMIRPLAAFLATVALVTSASANVVTTTTSTPTGLDVIINQTANGAVDLQVRNLSDSSPSVSRVTQTFVWTTEDPLDSLGFLVGPSQDNRPWGASDSQDYLLDIQLLGPSHQNWVNQYTLPFTIDGEDVVTGQYIVFDPADDIWLTPGREYGLTIRTNDVDPNRRLYFNGGGGSGSDVYPDGLANVKVSSDTSITTPFDRDYVYGQHSTGCDLTFFATSVLGAAPNNLVTTVSSVPATGIVVNQPVGDPTNTSVPNDCQVRNRFADATGHDEATVTQSFVWTSDEALDTIGFMVGDQQASRMWTSYALRNQKFLVDIQKLDGDHKVISTVCTLPFTIEPQDVVPGEYLVFDPEEAVALEEGQYYGISIRTNDVDPDHRLYIEGADEGEGEPDLYPDGRGAQADHQTYLTGPWSEGFEYGVFHGRDQTFFLTSVPEPGSLVILLIGGMVCMMRRGRR